VSFEEQMILPRKTREKSGGGGRAWSPSRYSFAALIRGKVNRVPGKEGRERKGTDWCTVVNPCLCSCAQCCARCFFRKQNQNHEVLASVNGDLILVQYQYNNGTTTPHMRVGLSMWDPPSYEGLLYSCCIDVVNLTFSP
jgi:hypothetical protein